MEDLTKTQIVLLFILISIVVSFTTAIVTAALFEQAPQGVTQTIQRVVERVDNAVSDNDKGSDEKTIKVITDEQRVIDVVRTVSPAVVSVVATKDLPVLERCFVSPFGQNDVFGQFFPELQVPQLCKKGTERREISSGTGFFVGSDGLIATNRHVVRDTDADYTVIMNDGRRIEAKVVARDPIEDLALVRVSGKNFPFIPLGDSSGLQLGQRVIAIGNALGEFQNTISVGVVSGLRRTIVASGEELRSLIQTDAAINPGNSGGPLLNLEGRVIGINTAVAAGAENIGFALPVHLLKKDIGDVEKYKRIVYPFLGVRYVMVDAALKEKLKLSVDYGALVSADSGEAVVTPGSPAEKAGIRAGDIILEIAGEKISKENPLASIVGKKQVGDTVSLKILRDGKEMTIQLALAERKF